MCFNAHFLLQKQEFNEERRQVLSDCAKRLYRDEPDLWKAATEEYDSKFLVKVYHY